MWPVASALYRKDIYGGIDTSGEPEPAARDDADDLLWEKCFSMNDNRSPDGHTGQPGSVAAVMLGGWPFFEGNDIPVGSSVPF